MIDLSIKLDGASSAAFIEAVRRLGNAYGDACARAPRDAAVQMCMILRKATKRAPKFPRPSEMTISKSDTLPKYITKDGVALRRYKIDRSTIGRESFDRFFEKMPTRKQFPIVNRDLGRRSWGWVMANIYKGKKTDAPWRMRKNDRRNPQDATKESYFKSVKTATGTSGIALISNRVDYIGGILKISQAEVINKTTSGIIKRLEKDRLRRAGVMSSREIRIAADNIASEFMKSFTPSP